MLLAGNHDNQHLQRAWNKYGADNFTFIWLEDVPPNQLLDVEQRYLDGNPDGYNLAKYAGAPMKGRRQSQKTIQQRVAKLRGRKRTPEQCRRISEAKKGKGNHISGRPCSEETRRKIADAKKGRCHLSREQLLRIAEANRGKHRSEETRRKMTEAHKKSWALNRDARLANRKPVSDETRQKLREATLRRWHGTVT